MTDVEKCLRDSGLLRIVRSKSAETGLEVADVLSRAFDSYVKDGTPLPKAIRQV